MQEFSEYLCLKNNMSIFNVSCIFYGFENYTYRLRYTNAWEIQILQQQDPTFDILKYIFCDWSELQVSYKQFYLSAFCPGLTWLLEPCLYQFL